MGRGFPSASQGRLNSAAASRATDSSVGTSDRSTSTRGARDRDIAALRGVTRTENPYTTPPQNPKRPEEPLFFGALMVALPGRFRNFLRENGGLVRELVREGYHR